MSDIYLDWDGISFKEFRKIRNNPRGKRSRGWMKNRIGHLWRTGVLDPSYPIQLRYRRSAGGRTHIWVYSVAKVPTLESLLLRVYLDDDHARVDMDVTRWSKGESVNRIFDTKYKDGKTGHAGPWVPWFTTRRPAPVGSRGRGPDDRRRTRSKSSGREDGSGPGPR